MISVKNDRFRSFIYICTLWLPILFICSTKSAAQSGKILKTVVLDAGHGGKDPGAIGTYSSEKNIALSVVLKLGKLLRDSLPQLKVVYTRNTDVFVELKERGIIANKASGDLFVSVHVNSTAGRRERIQTGTRTVGKGKNRRKVPVYKTIHHRETSTSGTETYVLGLTRTDEKKKAIGEFGDYITDEAGQLDENDPLTKVLIAQYSQAFLNKSANFAGRVQAYYAQTGRPDLGVKQQSLQVLANSAMPGVLTELGFINNPSDEAYLNSEAGQMELAMSLFRAIRDYKADIERGRSSQ
jgi:N-acetylmuramoyl-L-alanine amidase